MHISKLGEGRIERVEDAVNDGDQIEVEVTDVDRQGRISLTPVAWLERQVAQGKTIEEARAGGQVGAAVAAEAAAATVEAATGIAEDAAATVGAAAETAVGGPRRERAPRSEARPLVTDEVEVPADDARLGPHGRHANA